MKYAKKYIGFVFVLGLLFLSCEGKFEPINSLDAALLLLPANNQECLGIDLPNGKIQVAFDWEDVNGVSSYTLEYEDSVTGESFTVTSLESNLDLELEPGTLYSWRVTVSDDFGNSKTSDPFNFYTEGLAEENHVPFPAEINITDNGNGTVTIAWQGSDLDGDIDFYDVFFSNEDPPSQLLSETTDSSTTVEIQNGITYYLNVRTVDENGNYSDSKRVFVR